MDVAGNFESPLGEGKSRIRHPIAAFFHVFFRASALFVYVLLSYFLLGHFIELFITVILLLAFDFWTVKNVTGRLMVGLRWWNRVREDGSSEWMFESKPSINTTNLEAMIFWGALFASPLLWGLCLFTAVIKFNWSWAIITLVGITLNGSNVVGYVKCRRDAGAKISAMAGKFIGRQILKQTMEGQQTLNG